MKVTIEDRKENPLLERKELKGTIEHSGEATPSEEALEEFLSKELNTDKENVEVDKIFTLKGRHISKFWAKEKELGETEVEEEAETTEEEETAEEEAEEEEGKEETEEEENYEEALSGTISEGKEAVNNMDNPDYEKLLETEKENKDRKGMKKFLEKKTEE